MKTSFEESLESALETVKGPKAHSKLDLVWVLVTKLRALGKNVEVCRSINYTTFYRLMWLQLQLSGYRKLFDTGQFDEHTQNLDRLDRHDWRSLQISVITTCSNILLINEPLRTQMVEITFSEKTNPNLVVPPLEELFKDDNPVPCDTGDVIPLVSKIVTSLVKLLVFMSDQIVARDEWYRHNGHESPVLNFAPLFIPIVRLFYIFLMMLNKMVDIEDEYSQKGDSPYLNIGVRRASMECLRRSFQVFNYFARKFFNKEAVEKGIDNKDFQYLIHETMKLCSAEFHCWEKLRTGRCYIADYVDQDMIYDSIVSAYRYDYERDDGSMCRDAHSPLYESVLLIMMKIVNQFFEKLAQEGFFKGESQEAGSSKIFENVTSFARLLIYVPVKHFDSIFNHKESCQLYEKTLRMYLEFAFVCTKEKNDFSSRRLRKKIRNTQDDVDDLQLHMGQLNCSRNFFTEQDFISLLALLDHLCNSSDERHLRIVRDFFLPNNQPSPAFKEAVKFLVIEYCLLSYSSGRTEYKQFLCGLTGQEASDKTLNDLILDIFAHIMQQDHKMFLELLGLPIVSHYDRKAPLQDLLEEVEPDNLEPRDLQTLNLDPIILEKYRSLAMVFSKRKSSVVSHEMQSGNSDSHSLSTEMSLEEKEAETERLLEIFEKLDRNGIIKPITK